MNSDTARPTKPSMDSPETASMTAASRTAAVVMMSLRLSSEVASKVVELIFLPSVRLNRHSHSLTAMDSTSTAASGAENITGTGERIFPTEVFASSKPIMTIMAETTRPDRYSNRAWP